MGESVVAFAVATSPDVAGARRLYDLEGLDDADVVRALRQLRFQKTGDDGLPPHLCRVAAVAMAVADADGFRLEAPDGDERDLLQAIARGSADRRLVSWDADAFELPVLRYRALVQGLAAPRPGWPEAADGERHLALMPFFSGSRGPAAPLEEVARLLGLPVFAASRDEAPADRRTTCEAAALATYLIYLRYRHFHGSLDDDGLARARERVSEELRTRPGVRWAAFLDAGWQAA